MRFENLSRRNFLIVAAGGIVLSTVPESGCVAARALPLIIKVAPNISRVFWGAIQLAEAALTIKAVIDEGEKLLKPNVSAADIGSLQSNVPLIIQDGRGNQFNTPYVVCEYAGTVQSCYRGESRTLHTNPSFNSRAIRYLNVGEALGVIDLTHVNGWYMVQTVGGEKGWVHGNCLERLPRDTQG